MARRIGPSVSLVVALAALLAIWSAASVSAQSLGSVAFAEGDSGSAQHQVSIPGPFAAGSSTPYSTADGTATAGNDYEVLSGNIACPIGDGCQTMFVYITIHGDTTPEPDETFFINVQGFGSVQVTILNDDAAPPPDTIPPVVNVPGNMVVEAEAPGGTVVDYTATATDNVSGGLTPTCTTASGSLFPLGTTTVTCSATDGAGNTGSASFTVTVQDTTPPDIFVPNNQTLEATGPDGAAFSWSAPAQDLVSGIATRECSPNTAFFPLGTTTVTCTATDGRGNTGSASFTVIVQDTTSPVVTPPNDIVAEATGPDGAAVTFGTGSATDLVSGALVPTCLPTSGSTFALGDTTATCTATDDAGNTGSATFTVTVQDTTGPVVTVPDNMSVEATGPDGAMVTYSASATDLVDGARDVTCSPASGSTFALGETVVTCSAMDEAGNDSSATFTVTVADTTGPVVTVPDDIIVEATGPGGAAVTFIASADDVVDGIVDVTCLPVSGSTFALGDTTVTCSATDEADNTGSATFTITVEDTTAPIVTVPDDMTIEAKGADGATVSFSTSATDVVDGALVPVCAPVSGSTFPLGDTVVSCTATDEAGNVGRASFTITVEDTTAPVVQVPDDRTVEATGPDGVTLAFTASAVDLVDGDVPVTCAPPSGTTFPLGATEVECSATDAAGNAGAASFTVTVEDTTAPVVTVPEDMTVEATGPDGTAVSFTASASDLVDGEVDVTCEPASGSTFALGDTDVMCSATDTAGNTGSATFTISVVDTTAPVVSVPDDMTAEATGPGGAVVTFSAFAVDVVDGDLDPICDPGSGAAFPIGETIITCSASDASGNTSSATFTITVEDTTAPIVIVPEDMTAEATGPDGVTLAFTASATDIVDGEVDVTCVPASGSTFGIGDTTATCSATDAAGNTGSATFTITVVDTTAPIVTVPGDMTVEATGPDGAVVTFSASATDFPDDEDDETGPEQTMVSFASMAFQLVDAEVPVTCSPASGSTFPLGATTVTCSATDEAGNTGTATFTITVVDTTAPVITVPKDITVKTKHAQGRVVTFHVAAEDLVDGDIDVTCIPASGHTFPIGTTTVACAATDETGNTEWVSFTVTVKKMATKSPLAPLTDTDTASTAPVLNVTGLPSTGGGVARDSAGAAWAAVGGAVLLAGASLAVRFRGAHDENVERRNREV